MRNYEGYKQKAKEYRKLYRDRIKKWSHEYYLKKGEEIRRKVNEYQKNNRFKISERVKKRIENNPAYRRLRAKYRKEYYQKNKEKLIKYAQNYRGKNKEVILAKNRAWGKTEHGRFVKNEAHRKRYAREKFSNEVGNHSQEEWIKLLERFKGKCAYCGSSKKIEVDHIIPISKGGDNKISNIQPLCRSCNSRKKDKIIIHGI